jgi:hypothetical protein
MGGPCDEIIPRPRKEKHMNKHIFAVLLGAILLLPSMPSRTSGRGSEMAPLVMEQQAGEMG